MDEYLKQLVVQRDTVILPDFGALETGYEPASIDYVQGKLYPPNKSLSFNANLRINDGTFMQYVQRAAQTDYETAKQSVNAYIRDIQQRLAARETVHIAGIGKFFRDLNDAIHFLPEGQAKLYPATYGLPTISAYPVMRDRTAAAEAAEAPTPLAPAAPTITTTHSSKSRTVARAFQYALPALAVLAFVVIAFSIYQIQATPSAPSVQQVNNRINKKPGIPERTNEDGMIVVDETREDLYTEDASAYDDRPSRDEYNDAPLDDSRDAEAPTVAPGVSSDVIVVGSFGKPGNAERLLQRVAEDGYEGWSDRFKGLRRVGIVISFDSDLDRREQLETMRDRYASSAYLLSEK